MSDIRERDLINYDSLTEVTRRERRALLGVSMLGLALVKIPMIPTKFSALGIEFSDLNRQNFALIYALVIGYFFVAFLIYAIADYIAWRRSEVIHYERYLYAKVNNPDNDLEKVNTLVVAESGNPIATESVRSYTGNDHIAYRGLASWSAGIFASRLRAVFDLLLPPVFAAYVLKALVFYTP